MSARLRVGVLVSGSGSNLQALLDATRASDYPAEVVLVVSNIPDAFALERAKEAGVETRVLPHQAHPQRADFDRALRDVLREARVELVCLAGFMRLLGADFLSGFPDRVVNIHPALLPAFPGLHGPRQALAYGVKVTGCTVHFVDDGTDTGPIIAQTAVPVLDGDDEKTLQARVLEEEHRIYPAVVRWIAEGRVRRDGRMVRVDSAETSWQPLRHPA